MPRLINIEDSEQEEIVVGIDFGTTNSLIAYTQGEKIILIKNSEGKIIIPSVVSIDKDGNIVVGRARNDCYNIESIKRILGKSTKEVLESCNHQIVEYLDRHSELTKIVINNRLLDPIEIVAKILSYLKDQASASINCEIRKACITVPAYFDDSARNAVRQAARLAGLEVLRLINEPTAAAIAYGLDKKSEGIYLVYDLGGGTFDVSLLNMQASIFQVLATSGDRELGGDDIDIAIVNFFLNANQTVITQVDKSQLQNFLRPYARTAKEHLTDYEDYSLKIIYKTVELNLKIDRAILENLSSPLVERTIQIVKDLLEINDYKKKVKGVILVGGTTRMAYIRNRLKNYLSCPILSDIDPDTVVAKGAAIQAHNLVSTISNHTLIDVVPLSLGIEVVSGVVEVLIPRNSPIPISVTKRFTNYANNQTAIKIHIVQGERDLVENCRSLANFELTDIPLGNPGAADIELTFAVDADGILFVSAFEKNSSASKHVSLVPTFGLSTEEVDKMLYAAFENGEADYKARILKQEILSANQNIDSLEKLLERAHKLLTPSEKKEIKDIINKLRKATELSKIDDIRNFKKSLEKCLLLVIDKLGLRVN